MTLCTPPHIFSRTCTVSHWRPKRASRISLFLTFSLFYASPISAHFCLPLKWYQSKSASCSDLLTIYKSQWPNDSKCFPFEAKCIYFKRSQRPTSWLGFFLSGSISRTRIARHREKNTPSFTTIASHELQSFFFFPSSLGYKYVRSLFLVFPPSPTLLGKCFYSMSARYLAF